MAGTSALLMSVQFIYFFSSVEREKLEAKCFDFHSNTLPLLHIFQGFTLMRNVCRKYEAN